MSGKIRPVHPEDRTADKRQAQRNAHRRGEHRGVHSLGCPECEREARPRLGLKR